MITYSNENRLHLARVGKANLLTRKTGASHNREATTAGPFEFLASDKNNVLPELLGACRWKLCRRQRIIKKRHRILC